MKKFVIILSILVAICFTLFLSGCGAPKALKRWKSNPDPSGKIVQVNNAKLFYKKTGSSQPLIIVEAGLGTLYSKWVNIQDSLSNYGTVITYDRGDYGYSETSNYPRTSEIISDELNQLLIKESLTDPVILIGHSFGANQIMHHALHLNNPIKGLVLIDPAPYNLEVAIDSILNNPELGKKAKSFAEKTFNGGMGAFKFFGTSGMMYLFYKIQGGNEQDSSYAIVVNAGSKRWYDAMDSENENAISVFSANEKERLENVPLILITANHLKIAEQIAESENIPQSEARLLMELYHYSQLRYLELSSMSRHVQANTFEHDIYIYEPNIVIEVVKEILNNLL